MAEGTDQDQKTQEPTQQKLNEAARNGDILQSRELATAIMVGLGAGWVALVGVSFVASSKAMLVTGLSFSHADVHGFDPVQAVMRWVRRFCCGHSGFTPV
jgi:flagellar biosynthesis protein FlhB